MKKFLELISIEMGSAFEEAGYRRELGRVGISNRPDLCEFQCNGAMAGAKEYKKAPFVIASEVAEKLAGNAVFEEVSVVNPGFLNLKVFPSFLKDYLNEMGKAPQFGLTMPENPKKIVLDYGGPNVAKPLHVGHLRSAIIGESVKRIAKYAGHEVIGDIHMGDWGLQMGLIIWELRERQPELPYFDEDFKGEYPKEPPFTIAQLEEIYPEASKKSKEDAEYKERAMEATVLLQDGHKGYRALWHHIMNVSIPDLKRNYDRLHVSFDLWKGESDVHDIIPSMVSSMKENGYAYQSEGALIVDVKEESDTKEMPPCMILKSDGAALYNTTDLATIVERMKEYHPDEIIYMTDKRQELHFEQVFRCAKKTKLAPEETKLTFLGFGTMNGKDGKPFKTRDGGVLRLEYLLDEISDKMYEKIADNKELSEGEARETADKIALAALKYGDLSNQASKDYIFDLERFTSFEGDTGPYILYTIVRIKSILSKYRQQGNSYDTLMIKDAVQDNEKALMLEITKFNAAVEAAYDEIAPHKICAYIYDLTNAFNHFYHQTKILTEEDKSKQEGWIALLVLTLNILEACIDLLGFSSPERM